jgi:hypothetical protein
MCFLIINIEKAPNIIKIIGCALVFYWESTFFRSYYIIIAVLSVTVYILFTLIRTKTKKLSARKIIGVVLLLYLMVYAILAVSRVTMPESYNEVMICKNNTEYNTSASMIYDQIEHNGNLNLFMLNYVINSIRMIIPIELIKGGVGYAPFLIFQVLLLIYIAINIKNIRTIEDKNMLALSVFIAFFMGSVLFEPDFGSFARHEAASFPIIMLFALDRLGIRRQV